MTEKKKAIIEEGALERFPNSDSWIRDSLDKKYRSIFISGAEAMDEILQKEIAELKEVIKDNEKTIIRLTNTHD